MGNPWNFAMRDANGLGLSTGCPVTARHTAFPMMEIENYAQIHLRNGTFSWGQDAPPTGLRISAQWAAQLLGYQGSPTHFSQDVSRFCFREIVGLPRAFGT